MAYDVLVGSSCAEVVGFMTEKQRAFHTHSTTGKYVGIKKAQQERDRLKREEARKRAEEELEERLRYVKSPLPPKTDTDDDLPVLKEDLIQCEQIVRATQPESAAITRLEEERKKWRENSARLEESVKRLEEENSSLRRRLEDLEASNNSRTTTEEMLAMVEARVQARLESALMGASPEAQPGPRKKGRLGDTQLPVSGGIVGGAPRRSRRGKGKRNGKRTAQPAPPHPAAVAEGTSAPPQPIAGPSTAPDTTPAPRAARQRRVKPRRRHRRQRKEGKEGPGSSRSGAPPIATGPHLHGDTVGRCGKQKEQEDEACSAAEKSAGTTTGTPDRTQSATATLRGSYHFAYASGGGKGLSYKQVLTDAQTRVDLTGLDISRLKPKFAATGA
ncbi:zinc finger CCCH domain-containing protein 18-like, partial [Manduca sexta]|uniref:zinc finger CCCH domain-containing protein 18-like n=1 Tax=Manduca sexta TaxID=7130 RepID=UPI00188E78AE